MVLRPSLNPALRSFWLKKRDDVTGNPIRNRILYGGRSSSKSWDAAGISLFLACNFKLRILCTRQFQNKIEESVYALLKAQIDRFDIASSFTITERKIVNNITGSEYLFYGLWKSIDEIKSLEGIDILWIEEAHNLTEDQWKTLEPTIRKNWSQVWVIFNPRIATDFSYKRFVVNPPPDTIIRKINYDENPFLSQTILRIIESLKETDYDEYEHVYLGEPLQDDEAVIIKRKWIMASLDAHKHLGIEPRGRKRIGFDIADSGIDKCANVYAHGNVASWCDVWKASEDELLKSCTRTYKKAQELSASVTYDSIGVGASAGAKFLELNSDMENKIAYTKFNAGGEIFRPDAFYSINVKNKDQFSNIKAQAWWLVADRFRNTYNAIRNQQEFDNDEIISISSDMPFLDQLIDELSTPLRDFDKSGRVKVESKQDLIKREIASPNLADAFIMAFAPGVEPMRILHSAIAQAG